MSAIHYLARAETDDYPCMEFEAWYQQGKDCFQAQLNRALRKQAFCALCERWLSAGKVVEYWMLRAFVYGAAGRSSSVRHGLPLVAASYRWPEPPDASWQLVVCAYLDGTCELDFLHPVSRLFWSEMNGFLDAPDDAGHPYCSREWYECLGFDVLRMMPMAVVTTALQDSHLSLVGAVPKR